MAARKRIGRSGVTAGIGAIAGIVALSGCGGSVFSSGGGGATETGGSTGTGAATATGGSVGTGGTTATGGSSGSGGAAGVVDAGHDAAGPCTAGTVTFRMMAPAGYEAQFCTSLSCGSSFVTITDPNGRSVGIAGGCITTCGECQPIACGGGACAAPRPMTAQGEQLAWDGSYFVSSTCGSGFACMDHQCAAPGTYQATMCAAPNVAPDASTSFYCSAGQTPVCRTVSFEYPGAGVVTAVLAAIK